MCTLFRLLRGLLHFSKIIILKKFTFEYDIAEITRKLMSTQKDIDTKGTYSFKSYSQALFLDLEYLKNLDKVYSFMLTFSLCGNYPA